MSSSTPFFPNWRPFLAPRGGSARGLLRTVRALTLSQIEQRFAPALPRVWLQPRESGDHSRERVFSLARSVWCWIWQILQANTSCREVVRQVQALFALHGAREVDEDNGAYCMARGKVPTALLDQLLEVSFKSAERAAPTPRRPLLQNRPVRVADGSGTRLADTPANRKLYPPSSNLREGAGFPFLRIVVLFSLASGALLAQATGSLYDSEWRLWSTLLDALSPGDILLGDRAYGSFVVAALLRSLELDLIARVPDRARKVDFRKAKKRFGQGDALFVWKKPQRCSAFVPAPKWHSLPAELPVRLLRRRVTRRGFRTFQVTIVTTLIDPSLYPAEEILATHVRRWRMEMCLDDLKTTLGMENLRCQSPKMVEKELRVFLLTHNLIRWLMAQAAQYGGADLEALSFKGSLDAFRQWSQALAQRSKQPRRCAHLWDQLLATIAADLLPYRPGRHEPRAVKKRSKYPHLNRPRKSYRERPNRAARRRNSTARKRAGA